MNKAMQDLELEPGVKSLGFVFEWTDVDLVEDFRSVPALDQVRFEQAVLLAAERGLTFGILVMAIGGGWSGTLLSVADRKAIAEAVTAAVKRSAEIGGGTRWTIVLKDEAVMTEVRSLVGI